MSYTKRQFVQAAFVEIGLGDYAFDVTGDQFDAALGRLDSMMALWAGKGILVGYPIPGSPENSDLDADTGVTSVAWEAIIANLALRVAPSFGKAVKDETKVAARDGLNALFNRAARPSPKAMEPMLAGAGAKSTGAAVIAATEEELDNGNGSTLEFK